MRTMLHLSEIGAIVAPIVPAFYTRPKTLDEMIDHSIGRMLDLFGIDVGTVHRWKEPAIPDPSGMPKKRGATET
jgi:4-hydroxy-3-polyprenylbenzoate decarboxylase